MNGRVERILFIGVLAGLGVMLVKEAQTQVRLERQTQIGAQGLYSWMSGKSPVQIIDIRPLIDENDDIGGYEDTKIPNAIPFPGCTAEGTPANALEYMKFGVPTVIVSLTGDVKAFEACKMFPRGRLLVGGMLAWDDEGLPEDEGKFVTPTVDGGCLK